MKYFRARVSEVFQSFFGIMIAVIGVLIGLLALYCAIMMVWMMVKIFVITTWMVIQAVLWGIGATAGSLVAYGLFNGSSTLMKRSSSKRPGDVTIIQ